MIRALANASKGGMKINGIGRNLFASAFVALACLAAVAEDEAPAAPTGLGLAVVEATSATIAGLSRDTTYAVRVRAEWVKTRITMTSSVATAWT